MDSTRQKRKEEISKALTFIQSSLAYPEPEGYQDFLTQLVCNLLDEGNVLFREREWEQAVREFTEGLNVSSYAAGDDIQIPQVLLESLYVNRAAAYHSMGEYDRGVKDCDRALELSKESRKALYRKALCLKELGKHKEAYNCTTDCLLISRLVKEEGNWEISFPSMPQSTIPSIPPSSCQPAISLVPDKVDTLEDSEVMGEDLDSLLDCPHTTSTCAQIVPSVLPAPTPQLPPAFFNSALSQLNSLDSFSGGGHSTASAALDTLDDLLTSPGLDALDNFSGIGSGSDALNLGQTSVVLDALDVFNPLSSTHEFLQACSACYPRQGTLAEQSYLVHNCKRDILLCRRKVGYPSEWTRVRPMPPCTSFKGPFVLCKELLKSGDLGLCKYGEKCTFAYSQLEIDVWTEERKGTLDRSLLFETTADKLDPVNSIIRLLQEHKGTFMFLCQECYDNKPRIISKRSRDNHTICSNLDAHHTFDANKCLAFVVRTHNVNYRKVRPLSILCQLDLCHKAIRYGCQREDTCHYAHSIIELKTWRVQQDTGISPDEIVKVATKYHEKQEQNASKQKGSGVNKPRGGVGGGAGKNLDMKMKFACAQCWRDGLISEPDKTLKYCNAKARHMWTKDRRILLVRSPERSKWVQVRPLPHAKNFPVQYDICTQMLEKRRCNYTGKCTFAHSQEEKEMWMYMKNNDLRDMQQMYDMWLTLTTQNRQADGTMLTQPIPEEKYIAMPTDYAELMSGLYCRLCGKHSNSERQWQRHISSEKHKDRVFSCEGEDEALTWNYRFPGTYFELCPKLDGGCPDGASCDYAHSLEELQEWTERRDFLRQKLTKAREDMLIMPDEFDFGKYNFLLQN
uniref:Zinc finger CCCH-type containing 7B n=1 Tax=Lates calcarifer TaxID=8187 RepID=A0A4W6DF91_LATCA